MMYKQLENVMMGDILQEDIYFHGTLLLKKGTVLDKKKLHYLKNRNINYLKVSSSKKQRDKSASTAKEEEQPYSTDLKLTNSSQHIQQQVDHLFDKNKRTQHGVRKKYLSSLVSMFEWNGRYGRLFNTSTHINGVFDIYQQFCEDRTLFSLLESLKSWDYYTYIHSLDVFILGTTLAKTYQYNVMQQVAFGYLMHDIGKLAISTSLLQHTKLTDQKLIQLKEEHTIKGDGILRSVHAPSLAIFARNHHERLDGSGYPDQLVAENISMELRILQVIDAYSTMTLYHPNKEVIHPVSAIKYLAYHDRKFDRKIVQQLERMLQLPTAESNKEKTSGRKKVVNGQNRSYG